MIRLRRGHFSARCAFTLVELLTALLILSVLLAVSLALYLDSVAFAERGTCRSNMKTIANAVHANRVLQRLPAYPLGSVNAAYVASSAPDLTLPPTCPIGGTYSVLVGTGGAPFNVDCTQAPHGVFRYGIDTN